VIAAKLVNRGIASPSISTIKGVTLGEDDLPTVRRGA
jgi:hypothetical protein